MKKVFCLIILMVAASQTLFAQMTCDQGFQRLQDGNKRFRTDTSQHPNRTSERRQEIAAKQKPFAVIVGCSDSRVAPEILFDEGLGDLFIVRVAGNVVGPLEQDSIEYSVLYLDSVIVMVLGHENCGAVNAVVQGQTKDIEAVASLIFPAVSQTKKEPGDKLKNAIKANVRNVVSQLSTSPVLSDMIKKNKLCIKGGYYNFHTGEVEVLN